MSNSVMSEERLKFAARFNEVAEILGYKGHGKQSSIARTYGLKQPSTKKWFDGDTIPDFAICVDLCKKAKVHYEWFMTGRGTKYIGEYKSGDARIDHVIQVMQDMPEYKSNQIIKIIDTLAEPILNKTESSSLENDLLYIEKLNKNEEIDSNNINEAHYPHDR